MSLAAINDSERDELFECAYYAKQDLENFMDRFIRRCDDVASISATREKLVELMALAQLRLVQLNDREIELTSVGVLVPTCA